MSEELFDFRTHENFDFLEVSFPNTERKNGFLHDCERVLEYAHATVKDLCLLGLRLRELKDSSVWAFVKNPVSDSNVMFSQFSDFCEYAFGFSKTKVSDLISLSAFVKLSGENVDFIDAKYADFNTSQLVELSSVSDYSRKLFTSSMTIAEMRLLKKFLISNYCSTWTSEEALHRAKIAEESKKQKSVPVEKPAVNPDELPGKIKVSIPTESVGLADKTEVQEVVEETPIIKQTDETFYHLNTRAGIRDWLNRYELWARVGENTFPLFENIYRFRVLPNVHIYAVSQEMCSGIETLSVYTLARYYLKTELYDYPILVTKEMIEKYLIGKLNERKA